MRAINDDAPDNPRVYLVYSPSATPHHATVVCSQRGMVAEPRRARTPPLVVGSHLHGLFSHMDFVFPFKHLQTYIGGKYAASNQLHPHVVPNSVRDSTDEMRGETTKRLQYARCCRLLGIFHAGSLATGTPVRAQGITETCTKIITATVNDDPLRDNRRIPGHRTPSPSPRTTVPTQFSPVVLRCVDYEPATAEIHNRTSAALRPVRREVKYSHENWDTEMKNSHGTSVYRILGCGGIEVRLLASHLGEPGSTSRGDAPGFSHVKIVPNCAASRRVFSRVSPRPFIPVLLHTHFTLNGSLDRDVQGRPNLSALPNSAWRLGKPITEPVMRHESSRYLTPFLESSHTESREKAAQQYTL
ncbi:hypothetical protein PR048_014750 [Dryococelus australis]|uniref:Uncharacterized protein n=1 Tax=Dryococelus australis TaxID=614101 RepID=A0ABQ9HF16_9NEOP|nr:hypothetical protein PR048_014750 [Dryococelus australis]